MNKMNYEISPIGYVAAARVEASDDYWGESIAAIELGPEYEESALDGVETFSHVEILFLFDRVDPASVVCGARHPRNNTDWPAVGIFAQRGKKRPNRLGSTVCRVVGRNGRTLRVAELDAINGTPVIDIKPVMQEFLPRTEVKQPEWSSALMQEYWLSEGEG